MLCQIGVGILSVFQFRLGGFGFSGLSCKASFEVFDPLPALSGFGVSCGLGGGSDFKLPLRFLLLAFRLRELRFGGQKVGLNVS